jgi:4-aminobutyrate aminotransferase-like enzyme
MLDFGTDKDTTTIPDMLRDGVQDMQSRYPFFGEVVENAGILSIHIGVPGRGSDPYLAGMIQDECLGNGLLLATGGEDGELLQFKPAADTTDEQIQEAFDILEDSLEELFET